MSTTTSVQAILSSPTQTSGNMLDQQRSPPVLVRTAEMMAKSKLILKMPTVSASRVIMMKILPASTQAQQLPVHVPLTSQPSMPERHNIVPRLTETPCGQFNPEMADLLDDQISYENTIENNGHSNGSLTDCSNALSKSVSQDDQLSQYMETEIQLDLTSLSTVNPADLLSPTEEKKPMAKIDINQANQLLVCLNDEHMSLITPETEKSCFKFMHTNVPATASIIHEEDLKNLIFDEELLNKAILSATIQPAEAGNPFKFTGNDAEDMKLLDKLDGELMLEIAREENVTLDHGYSAAPKRKLDSADFDDESTFDSMCPSSVASSSFSSTAALSGKKSEPKKKRQRGIYRLEDVTNDEERQNYLERRKKNNISSKASRANKKTYFNQMEENSSLLEDQNVRLTAKIALLESHIKEIKSFLIDKFNTK